MSNAWKNSHCNNSQQIVLVVLAKSFLCMYQFQHSLELFRGMGRFYYIVLVKTWSCNLKCTYTVQEVCENITAKSFSDPSFIAVA